LVDSIDAAVTAQRLVALLGGAIPIVDGWSLEDVRIAVGNAELPILVF